LADLTVAEIVSDVSLSPTYAVMADETKDTQGIEDLAVAVRYLPAGRIQPAERCIAICQLKDQDAAAITNAIVEVLSDTGVGTDHLIAQAYDGASVMSGSTGGVNALLSQRLGRSIPYLHCFSHQLHLSVVGMLAEHPDIKQFLDICEQLYIFFRRSPVAKHYQGQTLKRLMEHRWSGHLATVDIISCNKGEVEETLEFLRDKGPADIATMAIGFLAQINTPKFVFITVFLNHILHLLEPVNRQLQADAINVQAAVALVDAARGEMQCMRSDEQFKQIANESGVQLEVDNQAVDNNNGIGKRKRRPQTRLKDYFVADAGYRYEDSTSSSNIAMTLQAMYFAVLDRCLAEFDRRFTERSMSIISAIMNLLRDDRTIDMLQPLVDLMSVCAVRDGHPVNEHEFITTFRAEVPLANRLLGESKSLDELFLKLQPHVKSLQMFTLLCTAALTLPCSTARVESCFSTLTRLLRPQRVSMEHDRKAQLVLLAFNKDIVRNIDLDKFVLHFAKSKHRRLLLL
jgi:hypothetical protein